MVARADTLATAKRRMHRSWVEDGLVEVFLGCVAWFTALAWFGSARLEWIGPASLVLSPAVIWLLGRGHFAASSRVVDSRTGYVRPRPWPPSRRTWFAIAAGRALFGAGGSIAESTVPNRLPAITPAFDAWWATLLTGFTAVTRIVGWYLRVGPPRHLWVAAIALAGAVAGARLGWHPSDSVALGYRVQGAALVAAGLFALRGYLRSYPHPTGE